jgi:hypothetical protein
MAQYLLSLMQPDGDVPPPEVLDPIMRELGDWNTRMREAGVWVFNGGLFPPHTATVLRPKEDDVLVTDGPYVEAREHLGGFVIVDVDDLDAALQWGSDFARITGLPVEVRPFAFVGS